MTNEAIRVKALEWTEDEPHRDQIDARVFVTVGSLGGYSIHVRTTGAIHSFNDDEMVGMTHDTLEEAKAACQADFARRVSECVEVMSTKPEKANTSPECVKPLDLCYVMQHALLAGQMGIRWENYDPTECSAYHRLTALQARCDELEAAARDLLDNAEPKWGDKVVVHRSVIEALRSAVDGGE